MSPTFEAFLAERPQLERSSLPIPGLCVCPDRFEIDAKPILVRHSVCDNTGYSFVDISGKGGALMRETTLEALAAWIPVPPPAPDYDDTAAQYVIARMIELGFHLVKLHPGRKKPMGAAWNSPETTPALTEDQALAHVRDGGGLGVLLGPSNLIVLDAENQAATDALIAAGLVPVLYTAKGICGAFQTACDPRFDKRGGGHFWVPVPERLRGKVLEGVPQADLGGGALVDVLVGMRQAVVPPTALVAAGGWRYTAKGGNAVWSGEDMPAGEAAAPWLFDSSVPCPESVRALHGRIGERVWMHGTAGPRSEASAELSEQLDAVPWDQVLALDPDSRAENWADDDDPECGCAVRHWRGASNRKSLTFHDCNRGVFAHVWSDTAAAELGLGDDQRTMSKAQLAAALMGVPSTGAGFREVAKRLGVELSGPSYSFADQLDEAADVLEDRADDPEQCSGTIVVPDPTEVPERVAVSTVNAKGEPVESITWRTTRWIAYPASAEFWMGEAAKCRAAARSMRSGKVAAPVVQSTETMVAGPVVGGLPASPVQPTPADSTPADSGPLDVETVEQITAVSPAGSELAPDDAIEGEFVDGTVTEIRAKEVFEALRGKIVVIEDLMRDLTPGLKRAYDYAESEGVFFHGFLGGLFPRLLQDVPPNVVMPPRNNKLDSKARGSGVNAYGLAVAPSSAGKGETQKAVNACVGVADGVVTSKAGTAEAWAKRLRGRSGGEDYIKATSLLVTIDEVVRFTKELDRNGSALAGFIASTWTGFGDGQDTSDEKNAAILPDHGSRIGITANAQPGKLAVLLAMAEQGATHRFYKCLVGIVAKEDRGPLYGCSVPAVVADQSAQPWYSTMPVGYPAVPCQQPQSARDSAGLQPAPAINKLGEGADGADGEKKGIPGYDNEPPIWIGLPKTAKADIEAGLDIAAERAANWWTAYQQDQDGTITGHRVQMHEMVAFCIALLDGECNVSEEHWEAARLWLAGSDLVAEAVAIYTELSGEAEAYRAGKLKGVGQAAARAADVSITNSGTRSAMQAIIQNLRKLPSCTSQPGYIKQKMSKKQVAHCEQAVAALQQQGSLVVGVDGAWTLVGDLAIAA